jgi:hypothetical protein
LEEFTVRRLFIFGLVVLIRIFVLLTSAQAALTETGVADSVTATHRNHRQHHSARVAAVAGLVY